MELSPGLIGIVAVVVVVVSFLLIRSGRRHEAAAPVDVRATPAVGNRPATARGKDEMQPVVEWLLARASEQTGVRVADDALARQRVEEAAAKVMEDLRSGRAAAISLPFLAADARGPRHFNIQFKRNLDLTFEIER